MSKSAPAASGAAYWAAVTTATRPWVATRLPRTGDTPLTLYRDANAWCPHCHKVFWYMEQKDLRYTTQRIHLQGDPREPPKQASFVRVVSPSGAVPVLEIAGEIVPESLHILRRLEKEFPDDGGQVDPDDKWAQEIIRASDEFDCDGDAWLQVHSGHTVCRVVCTTSHRAR